MQEKSCRCGASKKRFKFDIGPFYIAECCEARGFDALGNSKSKVVASSTITVETEVKPGETMEQAEERVFQEVTKEIDLDAPEEPVTPGPNEGEAPEPVPGDTTMLQRFFGRAGGRGKLMDMRIEDLKVKAKEKGVEGADQMTKKQLVAAILA